MSVNATEEKIWFYEQNGQRLGPVAEPTIMELIKSGVIGRGSAVWRNGFDDWQKIEDTDLRAHLNNSMPPPLTGKHVSNVVVWVLAFAPLIGLVLEYVLANIIYGDGSAGEAAMAQSKFWYVSLGLNIGLSFRDARDLRKAGYDTAKFRGWVWAGPRVFVPASKGAETNLSYFIVWMVCFGLTWLV